VACGTTLRHLRPSRFRRSRNRASVEVLVDRIGELVAERQELRVASAPPAAIELIDRYLPAEADRSAA
jgi:hypothetical protein